MTEKEMLEYVETIALACGWGGVVPDIEGRCFHKNERGDAWTVETGIDDPCANGYLCCVEIEADIDKDIDDMWEHPDRLTAICLALVEIAKAKLEEE